MNTGFNQSSTFDIVIEVYNSHLMDFAHTDTYQVVFVNLNTQKTRKPQNNPRQKTSPKLENRKMEEWKENNNNNKHLRNLCETLFICIAHHEPLHMYGCVRRERGKNTRKSVNVRL